MDTLRGSRCTLDVDDVVVACENRQVTIDMYRSACCQYEARTQAPRGVQLNSVRRVEVHALRRKRNPIQARPCALHPASRRSTAHDVQADAMRTRARGQVDRTDITSSRPRRVPPRSIARGAADVPQKYLGPGVRAC